MTRNRWLVLALIPLLGILAACGNWKVSLPNGAGTATCHVKTQGAKCVLNGQTVSAGPAGNGAPSPSETHRTPVPVASTQTPTQTPSASPTPQSTFDANAVSAVENCMNQFPTDPRDTLVSFSTSADARTNMAVCLQMPPQTVALFLHLLFKYAYAAYVQGDFSNTQGQQGFIDTTQGNTLPAAVIQCDKHYVSANSN